MGDSDCIAFLEWALPMLGFRWRGFRGVRRQVCRRLAGCCCTLGLPDLAAYRRYLRAHVDEWRELDALCRITISRFYRDQGVFELLEWEVLPALARDAAARGAGVEAWSAGCASGEEPYTLALVWRYGVAASFPGVRFQVLATDVDPVVLQRARNGCYEAPSLRDLPAGWRATAFRRLDGHFQLRRELGECVALCRHDVRDGAPDGPFDLVLCRNLAFTYYDEPLQRRIVAVLARSLRSRGVLVIGAHESLPEGSIAFDPWPGARNVYRRRPEPAATTPIASPGPTAVLP